MNTINKMELVFQDRIKDIIIVNTILGFLTDFSNESLTVMLQNDKFIILRLRILRGLKQ